MALASMVIKLKGLTIMFCCSDIKLVSVGSPGTRNGVPLVVVDAISLEIFGGMATLAWEQLPISQCDMFVVI